VAVCLWSDGREARQGTANPSTRVQIPFRPPEVLSKEELLVEHYNFIYLGRLAQR
jgi:hypothetical protein